jgi:hypothetical protein
MMVPSRGMSLTQPIIFSQHHLETTGSLYYVRSPAALSDLGSDPGQLSKPDFASDDDPRHRCVISADHPVGDRPRHEPVPDRGGSLEKGGLGNSQDYGMAKEKI